MRLLDSNTGQLHTDRYPPSVPYAILSYARWSLVDDESSGPGPFDADHDSGKATPLQGPVGRFCQLAQAQGYQYVWVDSVCIDKSSSADISETINLLPSYFKGAAVCFVYLADLACGTAPPCRDTWGRCQFWNRAWTLQELVLPPKIQFYDAEWHLRGDRSVYPLTSLISNITGIDEDILTHTRSLQRTSVARRMSWAALRGTTRSEDTAYALFGIFDVCMPVIYGEGGHRAFQRLQEEILKYSNDMSLFAWTNPKEEDRRGIFAKSPREFVDFGKSSIACAPCEFDGFAALTSRGVLVEGQFSEHGADLFLDLGVEAAGQHHEAHARCGILLRKRTDGTFERTEYNTIQRLPSKEETTKMRIIAWRSDIDSVNWTAQDLFSSHTVTSTELPPQTHSLSPSLQRPTTPTLPRQSTQQSASDSTPTWSCFTASRIPHTDEPGWVSVASEPEDTSLIDSVSEDDYANMQETQETELEQGWDPSPSVSSETTAASPPQSESGESDFAESTAPSVPKRHADWMKMRYSHGCKDRLAEAALDQFAISQKTENHVSEKRLRRSRRAAEQGRPSPRSPPRMRSSGPAEFACPFYKKDPGQHVSCLKNHELRDMDDVREHLWVQHRLPSYCPTCKMTFGEVKDRDRHIVQRNCAFKNDVPLEGVSEDQKRLMWRTYGGATGPREWYLVWGILFPGVERPDSPRLRSGLDLKVSSFREFWRKHGETLVRSHLERWQPPVGWRYEHDVDGLSREIASNAIATLVLDHERQAPA